ncbi:MAG: hypothetical protein ACOX8X_02280 [Methanomethylophilus sp.]|jgi:hypothetical protein
MESTLKAHRNELIALAAAAVLAVCAFGFIAADDTEADAADEAVATTGSAVYMADADTSDDDETFDLYEFAAVIAAVIIASILIALVTTRNKKTKN